MVSQRQYQTDYRGAGAEIMEVVIIAIVVGLFALGRVWLQVLQKKVPVQEARFIEKKYYGWIPISAYLLALMLTPRWWSIGVYTLVTGVGYWQVGGQVIKKFNLASICLILSTLPFYLIELKANYLMWIIFGSVLSDIGAYSLAKLANTKHYLPEYINKNKTYEGIVGGILGALLVILLGAPVSIAVVIGIAANIGDLINSAAKRQVGVKDWGEIFPGHGGIFDRFASFYMAYSAVVLVSLK